MEAIGTFLANTYIIFIIIAIFAIFALIGYVVESKTGVRKRINTSTVRPEVNMEAEMQKLKSDLANNNKGLGSMVNNPNTQPNQGVAQPATPGVINFDQAIQGNQMTQQSQPTDKL